MEKEDHHQRELQLLPLPPPRPPSSSWLLPSPPEPSTSRRRPPPSFERPSDLDLQLSISLQPISKPAPEHPQTRQTPAGRVEALKWQAAEQIRMAAMEKAYAERVRELTRREMELAQAELARARIMWERAREEVARAEMLKENAIVRLPQQPQVGSSNSSSCMEITCHSCRQRFRP